MTFDKGFSSALQQMARKVTFFPPPSGQTWESMAVSGAAFAEPQSRSHLWICPLSHSSQVWHFRAFLVHKLLQFAQSCPA